MTVVKGGEVECLEKGFSLKAKTRGVACGKSGFQRMQRSGVRLELEPRGWARFPPAGKKLNFSQDKEDLVLKGKQGQRRENGW